MSEQPPQPLSPTASPSTSRTAVKAPRFLASRQQPSKSVSDADTPPRPVREDRGPPSRLPPVAAAGADDEEKTSPRPAPRSTGTVETVSPRPPPRSPAPSVPLPPAPDGSATGAASPRVAPRNVAPLPPGGPSPRSSNRPPIPAALKARSASNAGVGSPTPPAIRAPTPGRTTQAETTTAAASVIAVSAPGPAPLVAPREDELEYEPDARDEVLFRYILEGAHAADLQQSGQRKRGESFF